MFLRTGISQYFSVQQSDSGECGKCTIKNNFLIRTLKAYDDDVHMMSKIMIMMVLISVGYWHDLSDFC